MHPDAQGQGLGKMLLNYVCGCADEVDVPVYLECAHDEMGSNNVKIYEKSGFKVNYEVEIMREGDKKGDALRKKHVAFYGEEGAKKLTTCKCVEMKRPRKSERGDAVVPAAAEAPAAEKAQE